jgi:hypothetical protein
VSGDVLWLCLVTDDGICHRVEALLDAGGFGECIDGDRVDVVVGHDAHTVQCGSAEVTCAGWFHPNCVVVGTTSSSSYLVTFAVTSGRRGTGGAASASQVELNEVSALRRMLSLGGTPGDGALAVACFGIGVGSATRSFAVVVHAGWRWRLWALASQTCLHSQEFSGRDVAAAVKAATVCVSRESSDDGGNVLVVVQLQLADGRALLYQLNVRGGGDGGVAVDVDACGGARDWLNAVDAAPSVDAQLHSLLSVVTTQGSGVWSAWCNDAVDRDGNSVDATGIIVQRAAVDGGPVRCVVPLWLDRPLQLEVDGIGPLAASPSHSAAAAAFLHSSVGVRDFYMRRLQVRGRFPPSVLDEVVRQLGDRSDGDVTVARVEAVVKRLAREADGGGGDGDSSADTRVLQAAWMSFIRRCEAEWRRCQALLAVAGVPGGRPPIVMRASGLSTLRPLQPFEVGRVPLSS